MNHHTYRRPFWIGLLHAISIVLYCMLISFVWLSITPLIAEQMLPTVNLIILMFVSILSMAVVAYFLFFEPFKLIVHHHFKRATVLLLSTFGWLFVFLIIFVLTLVGTYYS